MITSILDPELTSCNGLAVMVCMNNSSNQENLADQLLNLECRVYLAKSPEDALSKLQFHAFHVVIVEEDYSIDIMQFLAYLPMVVRRGIFYTLVGNSFETGNYMQGFVLSANLVANFSEMETFGQLLENSILDYNRFYRSFYYVSNAIGQKN